MYTFKKNSWHVRFYKWLFNVDPTKNYKSMCPYFWTYVLIFLVLPFILLIKLGGKYGKQFLSWIENYRRTKRDESREFVKKQSEILLQQGNPEKIYQFVMSKCFKEYYYHIDWDTETNLRGVANQYEKKLINDEYERITKRKEKLEKFYDDIFIKTFFITILIITTLCFAYAVYTLIILLPSPDWEIIMKIVLYAIVGVVCGFSTVGIIFLLIKLANIVYERSKCINFNCSICRHLNLFFSFMWNKSGTGTRFLLSGIGLFFTMIYNFYKKQCPLIKWED